MIKQTRSNWDLGEFELAVLTWPNSLHSTYNLRKLHLIGVEVESDFILRLIPDESLTKSVLQPTHERLDLSTPRRTGGRPAGKHGDAIAALTIRLSKLDDAALRRYTVASVASELEDEYSTLGETAPHVVNLKRFASGILRVLRTART